MMKNRNLGTPALLLLATLFLAACSGGGGSNGKTIDMKVDHEMAANELYSEYQKAKEEKMVDPLKEKYEGKKMMVTGKVKGTGRYSIQESGESGNSVRLQVDDEGGVADVFGMLKNDDRVDDLQKGMKVKIAGTYSNAFTRPAISDCEVEIVEN